MSPRQLQDVLHYLRRTVASPSSHHVADAELLERFVHGQDEAAFEALLWRHGKMVLSTCRRILRDTPEAEDAFQATFLALAQRAGSIGKRACVGGWLYRVAYRMALAARQRRLKRSARERSLGEGLAAQATDPAVEAAWQEICLVIDEEVNRLLEIYRLPLVLCYFEGKTNAEAARELGCAVGTIESRLTRARERLRVRLSRRGVTLSAGMLAAAFAHEGAKAAVPTVLFNFTARAAVAHVASRIATAEISARVAALTEGVLRAMFMTKLKIAALLIAVGLGAAAVGIFRQPAKATSPADQPQASQSVPAPDGRTELAEQRVVEGVIQKVDPAQRTVTLQVNALIASNNTWTNSNGSWTNVNNRWQDFALPQVSQFAPLTLRHVDAAQQTITVIPDQSTTWANNSVQWQNFAIPQIANGTVLYSQPNWVIPSVYAQSNWVGSNLIYNQPANYGTQLSFQEVKHKLTPHAKIIIDGKEARLVDLKPNTPVQLTLNKQGLVTRIEANGGTMQQCFVRSFDFTKHLITVRHYTNNVYQYELAPDARVEIDGRDSALTELKADMAVTLRFSAVRPKEVIALSTQGPEISVVLKSVNASGRTITLRLPKEHLTAADVPVAEYARILINGKEARLADLKPGINLVLHMAADPEKSLVMEIRSGQGK